MACNDPLRPNRIWAGLRLSWRFGLPAANRRAVGIVRRLIEVFADNAKLDCADRELVRSGTGDGLSQASRLRVTFRTRDVHVFENGIDLTGGSEDEAGDLRSLSLMGVMRSLVVRIRFGAGSGWRMGRCPLVTE